MIGWFLVSAISCNLAAQPSKENRNAVALQAAMKKEMVDGDLSAAIEQYKKLADCGDRAVAAQALVRMGECCEKLGDAEAHKAYERVVRDYADQKEALAAAQKHLADRTNPTESDITIQRIATFTDNRRYTSISRDGRYLAFTKGNGIYVYDCLKKEDHRIVTKDPGNGRILTPGIFPDGRHVAYVKQIRKDLPSLRYEFYVIGTDGANDVLLFSWNAGGNEEEWYSYYISPDGKQVACHLKTGGESSRSEVYILDTGGFKPRLLFNGESKEYLAYAEWAPDGKYLLGGFLNDSSPGNSRLQLISLSDGSSRLVGAPAYSGHFSPDGSYIAFYQYPFPGLNSKIEEGLYLTPGSLGEKVLLVRGPASDPRWTPDGTKVLFRNQRPEQTDPRNPNAFVGQEPYDLYAIRVKNGRPAGKPMLLKNDMVMYGRLLGAGQDGSFYYADSTDRSPNYYAVNLDPKTKKVVSKPSPLFPRIDFSNGSPPRLSPDGQWCGFKKRNYGGTDTLTIVSAGTGEEREVIVSPPFDAPVGGWSPIQGFADNRSVLVVVQKNRRKIFRKVDIRNGKHQVLFKPPEDENLWGWAALSPDGQEIYFVLSKPDAKQPADRKTATLNTVRLMRRNLESGEEKELCRASSPTTGLIGLILSTDGRQLALFRANLDNTVSLFVIPAGGGDARELYRSNLPIPNAAWSKDGRHILMVQKDPDSGMDQVWSVSVQSGERLPIGLTLPMIRGVSNDHDDRRLLFWGRQSGPTDLWVMKLPTAGPRQ